MNTTTTVLPVGIIQKALGKVRQAATLPLCCAFFVVFCCAGGGVIIDRMYWVLLGGAQRKNPP